MTAETWARATPMSLEHMDAPAIVRGGAWRCAADADFYAELDELLRW